MSKTLVRELSFGMQDDPEYILWIAKAMHIESSYAKYPMSEQKARQTIHACLSPATPDCFALGGFVQGELVGVAGGYVAEHWGIEARFASDFLIYVLPELRGSTVGLRLIRAFEQKSKELGAVEARLGVTAGIHVERTAQLYERLGYRRDGVLLTKRLENVRISEAQSTKG